jgi:hypothetical protein
MRKAARSKTPDVGMSRSAWTDLDAVFEQAKVRTADPTAIAGRVPGRGGDPTEPLFDDKIVEHDDTCS